jgi:hypothetical protein
MAGFDIIQTTLQSGVSAIRDLTKQIGRIFPSTTASSSAAPATAGTITFSSSLASGFMLVQTSSGGTVKIAFYNQ